MVSVVDGKASPNSTLTLTGESVSNTPRVLLSSSPPRSNLLTLSLIKTEKFKLLPEIKNNFLYWNRLQNVRKQVGVVKVLIWKYTEYNIYNEVTTEL